LELIVSSIQLKLN